MPFGQWLIFFILSSKEYKCTALLCIMWYAFGRESDLALIQKCNLSVSSANVLSLRLIRPKTSEEQGLSLFPDKPSFIMCPLYAIGMAMTMQTHPTSHPNATFEVTREALVAKFRSTLTDQEITLRIYSEGKLAPETYQEYADRLLQMVAGLTGGVNNVVNVNHALGTFLRLAWSQRKVIVQVHVRGK
ncbi:hypothetical protein PHMEG_0006986 [Phytophthora megakarya]|uniref:Uncharacterized protein n=1 Tax=Phytophthora megakarya TaxID=4795 RepID=A0A225WNJ5_9STRA|nr:hypothetical protein PHMEG_0006986 [Phytophthora megakarya]